MTNGVLYEQAGDDASALASAETLRRILDIARIGLRARGSAIRGLAERDVPPGETILAAEIRPEGSATALLVVFDEAARTWSDDDRHLLDDLAATLAADIALRGERERQQAILDHLPGLVFERRKTGPAETRYTFLGAAKTALPAVREMMDGGSDLAPLQFVHRDDRAAVRQAILRSTVEENDLDLLFRIKDFDHRLRWLSSRSVARREADGSLSWSGLCIDVTDLVARSDEAAIDPLDMVGAVDLAGAPGTAEGAEAHAAMPPASLDEQGDEDALLGDGRKILLADDLDLNRKLIADMLSIEGYDVDCVPDGAAAVEAARAKRYALILMDMIMPGMDGLEATRAIRALPSPACDVPIVALTAHSLQEQLDTCIDAGMDATLTKPMSFDALSTAVGTWTRQGRQAV